MVKIQESNGRFWVTLPKEMMDKKKWEKGKTLFFTWNERGNIEIHD